MYLRAVGTGSTGTLTSTSKQAGNSTITLTESQLPKIYGYLANNGEWLGLGEDVLFLSTASMSLYGEKPRGWHLAYGSECYPAGVTKGEGKSIDINPPYRNVHIWKRTA